MSSSSGQQHQPLHCQPNCRQLAREGERAIRTGDASKGIELLERALQMGTDELGLLCALYSQLGNAYFARRDYGQARFYHLNDLYASRLQKDELQQAKAYSNLSATYTMLADFENAIVCANNVVGMGQRIGDRALECRGYYNLGLARLQNAIEQQEEGEEEEDEGDNQQREKDQREGNRREGDQLRNALEAAVDCFQKHIEIAEERKDRILSGLGIGNLGNAYFYLGEYAKSIECHQRRLAIARQLGDNASIRRSLANIGRANVLLGELETAKDNYKAALELAQEMDRPEVEAQLLFDMGNIESAMGKHREAIEVFARHLGLARRLNDVAGTIRANSSLAAEYAKIGMHRRALTCLVDNYNISAKDESMKATALEEIRRLVQQNPSAIVDGDQQILLEPALDQHHHQLAGTDCDRKENNGGMRTPTTTLLLDYSGANNAHRSCPDLSLSHSLESFIRDCAKATMSSRMEGGNGNQQSAAGGGGGVLLSALEAANPLLPPPKRRPVCANGSLPLDGGPLAQRSSKSMNNLDSLGDGGSSTSCSLSAAKRIEQLLFSNAKKEMNLNNQEEFFELIERLYSKRMQDQRAEFPASNVEERQGDSLPANAESLLAMIAEIQGRRYDDQRASPTLPDYDPRQLLERLGRITEEGESKRKSTEDKCKGKEVDDSLYDLIMSYQASRIEDQRSELGGSQQSGKRSSSNKKQKGGGSGGK